ncbi:MAG: aspartyl protease family protein [Acidobacteria bacterium]|nr:aspartyl protease family protein [Acidobacteriota bacterium]
MGLTHVQVTITNPGNPRKAAKLTFLVDSGAIYSVVPKAVLRRLGVKPHSKRTFTLADGSRITRQVGDVVFKFDGQQGASPVIFGEKGDSILLGTVSLEALGFMLDPIRRELRPLPPVLAEGYRAMAGEDRETAERHVAAFREILRMPSKVPRRLVIEAKKLNPKEERALAEEGMRAPGPTARRPW